MKTDALNSALDGINRARERLNSSAQRVAEGEVSAEAMIETKLAARDVEANLKVVKVVDDLQKKLLDEIA